MYKLIYTIPFTSVDGDNFTVQILEDGGTTSPVELTGGTPPFIVEYGDTDFLYTPTRFSGATLKLVGSDYLQRLFSTQYQKFKVNLLKGTNLIWTGFITPEVYSQDYDNSLFELEIECISAMATLEYIEFDHSSENISFLDLIKKCITESKGDFKAVYLPNTYTESLDNITISKANFFDEEDKPMTLKECLEEVCKFLNWTVTEYNGNVYFIDVDYIKKGNKAYTDILSNSQVNLSSNIEISSIPSKGVDNSISILGGYNEATVIDSDYEVESEDLFHEITLDNKIKSQEVKARADGKSGTDCTYKYNWYNSDNFNPIRYTSVGGVWQTTGSDNPEVAGTHILNFTSFKDEDKPISLNWEKMFEIKMHLNNKILDDSDPNPEFEANNILDNNIEGYLKPQFTNVTTLGSMTFPDDAYLGINFSVSVTPSLDGFRGIPIELNHKNDSIESMLENSIMVDVVKETDLPKLYFVPVQIKIGDKYYNGTNWTTTSSVCQIPLDVNFKTHIEGKWLNVKNTNSFEKGVEDLGECYLIKLDRGLYGKLEITFMIPCITTRSKEYIYIKDIKVESARIDLSDQKKEKQDTKYTNVVNESYINALEDIEFKVTSKNDSNICFSKAIINNQWLDTLYNTIYNTNEKPEKLLIQRIINQYKQPKFKLVQVVEPLIEPYSIITDKHISGKKFIFTGGSVNYEDNLIECNMIEIN